MAQTVEEAENRAFIYFLSAEKLRSVLRRHVINLVNPPRCSRLWLAKPSKRRQDLTAFRRLVEVT